MIESRLPTPLSIGGRTFHWGSRTYIMGIINVSPESFSGDGIVDIQSAIAQGVRFIDEGADILDVGGQSTRPVHSARVEAEVQNRSSGQGYTAVSVDEELRRIVPVVAGLAELVSVPISIDTYKVPVAREAVRAGASLINDVWGLKNGTDLARIAAEAGIPMVLMHNQEGTQYSSLIPTVIASLRQSMATAMEAGVPEASLILDPGFGFGKTVDHNLEVLRELSSFRAMGRPLLLGTSRKSTIGRILDAPVDDRLEGTAATVALGIANGADIIRVHDVHSMAKVARMTDAVVRARPSD